MRPKATNGLGEGNKGILGWFFSLPVKQTHKIDLLAANNVFTTRGS